MGICFRFATQNRLVMTTEEFNSIKLRLVGHLSTPTAHYSTYKGEWNSITITAQTANRVLKNGGYGKTSVAYLVGQREFKNKEELIKYLNELTRKEVGNEND